VNVINLNTQGEIAPIIFKNLLELRVSLLWKKEEDLDLVFLYKTPEGDTGVVSADEEGDLEEFPFLAYQGGGVENDGTDVISYEKFNIKNLSDFSELYIVVTSFSELMLGNKINFKNYDGLIKIASEYQEDKERDTRYTLGLKSEVEGDYYVLGQFDIKEGHALLTNTQEVLSTKDFKDKIPGAKLIAV